LLILTGVRNREYQRRKHQYHEEPSLPSTKLTTTPTRNSGQQQRRTIFQVTEGHRSKESCDKYRNCFNRFLNYVRIYDLDVLLDLGREAIQQLVINYVISMRDNPEKSYARSTINTDVAAILYFFDNNDIELNRHKIRRFYPSDESTSYNEDRPYTIEEIQRILSLGCNDLRSKAIVLLLASSGIRIGALPSLQIGDLTKITLPNRDKAITVYKIQVYARSKSDRYYTFCTPECYKAIRDYLDYRRRCGEKIQIELETELETDSDSDTGTNNKKDRSPLFRRQFNKENPFEINAPRPMGKQAFTVILDEALKRSGVKTSEAMRSHAFRKGFKSICEQKGMKSLHVEMLMGHNVGLASNYYRPAESDLLEDYINHAVDSLTIDPTFRLQKRVARLESERTEEIAKLKEQYANASKMISDLQAQVDDNKLMFEYGRQELHEYDDKLEESKAQHEHTLMYMKELEKRLAALGQKG
jgi:integrase